MPDVLLLVTALGAATVVVIVVAAASDSRLAVACALLVAFAAAWVLNVRVARLLRDPEQAPPV